MSEKCHICETGWETGDLQFIGIMPDGDEIWVHGDDCAYALEKLIECLGNDGWMTIDEYAAASAFENGFDAWQRGYDDAMYDGIDTSNEIPCKCESCLKAYEDGQQKAIEEIFGRRKK